jgi:hypothetical protein
MTAVARANDAHPRPTNDSHSIKYYPETVLGAIAPDFSHTRITTARKLTATAPSDLLG